MTGSRSGTLLYSRSITDRYFGYAKALLERAGYRVPEDISVVGFDGYIYPGICKTGITTCRVDMEEKAP